MSRLFHLATAVLPFFMFFGSPEWFWNGLFVLVCGLAAIYFQGFERHPVPVSRQLSRPGPWADILVFSVYTILAFLMVVSQPKLFVLWISTYSLVWGIVYLKGRRRQGLAEQGPVPATTRQPDHPEI